MKLGLPISISVAFWIIVGLLRSLHDSLNKSSYIKKTSLKDEIKKTAVCMAAHNEEKVIEKTINTIKKQIPAKQIFVVSDGSTDSTAKIARRLSCQVLENKKGLGKASALAALFKHFNLIENYKYIILVDAEVKLGSRFVENGLRRFISDPKIVAIAGYVITPWRKHKHISVRKFIKAYRVRLNSLLQMLIVYGQTWKFINTPLVVPGGCSIYRSWIFKKVRIDTPGLLIEDFNLTFQIHKFKLGKVSHFPEIYIFDQEPATLADYWRQIHRWNVGFLQALRINGIWLSFFWFIMALFTIEVFINALIITVLPVFLYLTLVLYIFVLTFPAGSEAYVFIFKYFTITWSIFLVFFVFDYVFTFYAAIREKKPLLLIYGLGFLLFRFIDSVSFMYSIPKGFFVKSSGRWSHPKRV